MASILIQHHADVLCVWAYVSQIRLEELEREFGDEIAIEHHWLQVFGNVGDKLYANWRDKGGAAGYSAHVKDIVARFGHVPVHPEIWQRETPSSSLPAHAVLCAVRLLDADEGRSRVAQVAGAIRRAFFRDLVDVSHRRNLLELVEACGIPAPRVEALLDNGAAWAALSSDLDLAREQNVRASPTLIFNEGRQRLTGNVGYRVIEANVRELLQAPAGGQSWC
ncbi:MAG: DsbA family protein [Gammaproteobacteria bacterium]